MANGASDRSDETTTHDAEDRRNKWNNSTQRQNILHDEGNSAQLMEQQAESVRYLNELNAVSNDSPINRALRLAQ